MALFRGNVCIWTDKISNVSAILGQKCTASSRVNQNTKLPPMNKNLNFGKEWAFLYPGCQRFFLVGGDRIERRSREDESRSGEKNTSGTNGQ